MVQGVNEMKYIEEKALKEQFWKKYGYRSNIIAYQFECKARTGGVDLLTVEKVKDDKGFHIELCSFEFKLADIDKAFSQAHLNSEFCHKNFVVVPMDKKKVILDKYSDYFKKYPHIGCIGVYHPEEEGGKWEMFHKCRTKADEELKQNQEILKLCTKII